MTSENDLINFLNTRQPIILKKVNFSSSGEEVEKLVKTIAPLNTDISIISNIIPYTMNDDVLFGDNPTASSPLPESFSWSIPTKNDSNEIINKKINIHPVFNQYGCGSCWAVTIATTMSDCLVVSGVVDWCPMISPTYIMMITPFAQFLQRQCLGGSIANAIKYLSDNQIKLSDSSCVDYSWCDKVWCSNPNFNDNSNTFKVADYYNTMLNKTIPPIHGCYYDTPKWAFKLDKFIKYIPIDFSIEQVRNIVKGHILTYGPVIGSFVILKQFIDDGFTTFNGGVYFDRADYENYYKTGKLAFSPIQKDNITLEENLQGTHSVSIVGWGVAKNIQYDNDKFGDVPYWLVRNSWGDDWGDDGYFKMAMYPFNLMSQFERPTFIKFKNKSSPSGPLGMILLIKATSKPEILTFGPLGSMSNIYRSCPSDYYSANPYQIRNAHRGIAYKNIFNSQKPQFPITSSCKFGPNPHMSDSLFPPFYPNIF